MEPNERHALNDQALRRRLAIDCGSCCGLCCTALYFAKSEGFPADKPAGKPCKNLLPDHRCAIHGALKARGLKGCLAYDCFGAGQRVAARTFGGRSWTELGEERETMFAAFLSVYGLHQMLWYLLEAASLRLTDALRAQIDGMIGEIDRQADAPAAALAAVDPDVWRGKVNPLLRAASETLPVNPGKPLPRDLFGCDLRRFDLSGRDLSMTLLIAADLRGCALRGSSLLGADLRDARLHGADLSQAVFLTQAQLNAAAGDGKTKLPASLRRPATWT